MKNVHVIFEPGMIEVYIPAGSKIVSAIEKAGVPFELPCGGKGICGKCGVRVLEGASKPNETEKKLLGGKVKEGWRLACQSRIQTNSRILLESKSSSYHKILTSNFLCDRYKKSPSIVKKNFNIPPITLENPVSFEQQIAARLGVEKGVLSPFLFRDSSLCGETKFTAIFYNKKLISLEKENAGCHLYGIGFDLGTTTMVLTVFDLEECREVITIVRPNPQIKFGDDVISRVDFSMKEGGLKKLNAIVVDEINKMIDEAAKTIG
ncbi:MAG: 2Fe-2S iron-sulfur cluster-binding protein, partial [Candidatus Omnitrophica bacterium]|nr:2Fe-2S iron-sulfur cluster-binding protein [Candidatus Omnitrophota bacterium]